MQTPRAQRTSTDAQTWEFSHHKFLRGRPDLLDEIKRKALEPDPSVKHRVELPGEVAAQLGAMREQHRRVVKALEEERVRVERLTSVVKTLHEILSKICPGSCELFFFLFSVFFFYLFLSLYCLRMRDIVLTSLYFPLSYLFFAVVVSNP